MNEKAKNSRIAKNTLMLYIRMFFLMGIGLYTSRIVLQALGVEDYGIYNVVGGVVTTFTCLSGTMSAATSRFITIELGKGDIDMVKKVFRSSLTIHYILAIIVFALSETIGLWFVLEKMVIPPERMTAALWVYHLSIITFVISIISIPYNALIIAHEKMNAFAYISIFEGIIKLIAIISLNYINVDSLILYAIFIFIIQVTLRLIYTFYCNKNFKESSAKWLWDKRYSKEILVYAGWTLNGGLAVVGFTQGINILLNMFFGPTVNAARAIAVRIQSIVNQFFTNFQMAVRPQITKSYAQGNLSYMHSLIINTSRYSFYLILLIAFPIFINTEYILNIWLGVVPEYTVNFTRIMILTCMNGAMREPTLMAIHATGDVKKFQIIEGTLLLTVLPICYIGLKYYQISPEAVFLIYFIIECITQFARVFIVYPKIQLPIKRYFTEILFPIFVMLIPTFILGYLISLFICVNDFKMLIFQSLLSVVSLLLIVFIFGLKNDEKKYLANRFVKVIVCYLRK